MLNVFVNCFAEKYNGSDEQITKPIVSLLNANSDF